MTDTVFTLMQEQPAHDPSIDMINDEAFGPARFVRAAHFIREQGGHDRSLSFVAFDGDQIAGSVRLSPIVVGGRAALLLGPLVVRPCYKNKGLGGRLMQASLEAAQQRGYTLVFLVGDAPYYAHFGFQKMPAGYVELPAPVDTERLLYWALDHNAIEGVSGKMRHATLYRADR